VIFDDDEFFFGALEVVAPKTFKRSSKGPIIALFLLYLSFTILFTGRHAVSFFVDFLSASD